MITGDYVASVPDIYSSTNSKGNIWLFSCQTLHISTSFLLTLCAIWCWAGTELLKPAENNPLLQPKNKNMTPWVTKGSQNHKAASPKNQNREVNSGKPHRAEGNCKLMALLCGFITCDG